MFYAILTRHRRFLGLTQRQLAAAVGISASALGMYEQGRRVPGPRTAARLSAFFQKQGLTLPPVPRTPEPPPARLLARGLGGSDSG